MEMKEVCGIYLPDAETHLVPYITSSPTFAGKRTYQIEKFKAAIPHMHDYRHAIDIGANVGMWSWPMSRLFTRVSAFEPLEFHRECFVKNAPSNDRCEVKLYDCGLGSKSDLMGMDFNALESGGAHLKPLAEVTGGEEPVRIATLDSFPLTEVDFIKIDVEGFEVDVLRGGEQTIRRWKPTIVVEQKPGNGVRFGHGETEAVDILRSWGAEKKWESGGDNCLRWKHR
jgi:FkbM family methyltransferase